MWSATPSPLLSTMPTSPGSPSQTSPARGHPLRPAKSQGATPTITVGGCSAGAYFYISVVSAVILVLLVLVNNPLRLQMPERLLLSRGDSPSSPSGRSLLQHQHPSPHPVAGVTGSRQGPSRYVRLRPSGAQAQISTTANSGAASPQPQRFRDGTEVGSRPAGQGARNTRTINSGWLREYLSQRGLVPHNRSMAGRPGVLRQRPLMARQRGGPQRLAALRPGAARSPGSLLSSLVPMTEQRKLAIEMVQRMQTEREATYHELYETPRTPNLVRVSPDLPPQDLGGELYGCFNRGYQREECPQGFMDGAVKPAGAEGSGPYMAFMRPARNLQQQTHAPTILSLPNGDLLASWFDGAEGLAGVGIVVSRLPAGPIWERNWTKPEMVSLDPDRSAQNPVLWYDEDTETVYLAHTSQKAMLGQGTSDVRWLSSSDMGHSWTKPQALFTEPGAFIRNSLILGVSGEWLLPMYYTPGGYEDFVGHFCTLKRSSDKGQSWPQAEEAKISHTGQHLAQPTTIRLSKDPPILMTWMRDRKNMFIYSSRSADDGVTWSQPKRTRLPSNNSGIQALLLSSGAVALVFNNKGGVLDRWPITIALSYDQGETWPHLRDLDREPLALAYPALTQTSDGLIHIMYSYHRETIKYVAVTEEWIKAGSTKGLFKGDKDDAN